jgi:hypothetical protein
MASYRDEKSDCDELVDGFGLKDADIIKTARRRAWWKIAVAFVLIGLINYAIIA